MMGYPNLLRAGWYCPGCGSHHSPDISTCPGKASAAGQFNRPTEFPPGYQYAQSACGCASPKCMAEGCQSRKQTADAAWRAYGQRGGQHQ